MRIKFFMFLKEGFSSGAAPVKFVTEWQMLLFIPLSEMLRIISSQNMYISEVETIP